MVVLLDELCGTLNSHECHVDVGIPRYGISWPRLDATNTWHLLDRHITPVRVLLFLIFVLPLNTFPAAGKAEIPLGRSATDCLTMHRPKPLSPLYLTRGVFALLEGSRLPGETLSNGLAHGLVGNRCTCRGLP